ncbi:M48 family metallopeptidase [Marivirga sp. S37H4]|uniref:M48 family metallopeptidase n=1 Tax=Marivirga aurantiaca TaxID=2802615 RepID=A0A934WVP1_9BACT|nr:M48 family metallopeptidase [Marivirga aurantiaca]MBK6263903.1 M48 family metallopeptidase [Marivirga aurantiaca]
MKKIFYTLVFTMMFVACNKVPLSNRSQLSLVPKSQLMASSFSSYDQVLSESKLSNNTQQVQMIRNVGNKIKVAVEKYLADNNKSDIIEDFEWEFNLIQEDVVNAWCMPGGKVAFYTGILPVCQDEEGIAVVMGHEVAHAVARHGGERMSQALIQQLGGVALSVALREQPEQTQALAMAAYTGGSTVLGVLPFSRLHESEADRLGLTFMAMAGYNPEAAPEFWKRMQAKSAGSPPEFLSTHPSGDTRIKDLNKWMPEANKYYQKASKESNSPIPQVDSQSDNSSQTEPKKKKKVIQLKIDN